jgi:hypothetical protein
MVCQKDNKRLEDTLNPGLYDRSYDQNPSSQESRLSNRVFRDEKTGALIIPTGNYLLGPNTLGRFGIFTNLIENDRDQPESGYQNTINHELRHAEGDNEYVTRFRNKDPYMDYN